MLPWHEGVWAMLAGRRSSDQVPHALLLCGGRGMGKLALALRYAHSLLCGQPDAGADACGVCRSCTLLAAGTHPDMQMLAPEEEGKEIRVDAVRELIAKLWLTSQLSGYKVAIAAPAERLNPSAANALLKTLEEPPVRTVLLLVTEHPGRLPATIRSRCQQIILREPPREQALDWLAGRAGGYDPGLLLSLAGGAPLLAEQYGASEAPEQRMARFREWTGVLRGEIDPVPVAQRWSGHGTAALQDLVHWLSDMIRLRLTGQPPRLASPDLAGHLQGLAEGLDLKCLYERLDHALEALRLSTGQINMQLLMEDLLVAWAPSATDPGASRRA